MARIIEEVAILIGADTRKLNKGMQESKRHVNTLTSGFKRLGGIMAGAFSARALFRGFKRTLDTTNALIKTAKGVGFAVGEYQQLTFALSQVGVEASAARIALGDFQKRLAKPQFHKFFRQAGLDPKELQKLSPAAAFETAFDHLATLVDHPKAAAFFGTIFEEQAGKNMLKAARQMDALLAARKDYDRYVGGGIGRAGANDIERLKTQTTLLNLQWEQLKATIVADAAPAIIGALKKINESGLLKGMGHEVSGMIKLLSEFSQAIKLVLMDYEKLTGTGLPGAGAATSAKNKRTGLTVQTDIPDISPSGIFGKTISGEAINRARVGQKQLHSGAPLSTSNIYNIKVEGFPDGKKAGKELSKELDRRVRQ